jgi:predicted regulator of Ras-like GTPase activity (Roadblock/LC7/MglB family)/ribosomal protein L40E
MIICSNCGATNNEESGQICRKCGALLPTSRRPPRIRMAPSKKEKKEVKPQKRIPDKKKVSKPKPDHFDLQEIPKPEKLNEIEDDLIETQTPLEYEDVEDFVESELEDEEEDTDILKEITPKPYKGSIISDKEVFGPPRQVRKSVDTKSRNALKSTVSPSEKGSVLLRQKQLEEDMSNVLSFLSKKITVKPLESIKKQKQAIQEKPEEKIPPSSMNEILKDLLKLDLHIEASAIIKSDGSILASAISSRISETLFATIGQNLSMIGNDIIKGLSAGTLLNISIRGTNGVLDLAPIGSKKSFGDDMILIILSHPRVKSGIIYFAVSIVKKQVKQYLGLLK